MAERFPGNPPTRSDDEIVLGRWRFGVVYRKLPQDEGPTIHVFGPAAGSEEEILRFDCFRNVPHYHVAFSYRNEHHRAIEADNPFVWAVDKLRGDFAALVDEADADEPTEKELGGLAKVLDDVMARHATLDG